MPKGIYIRTVKIKQGIMNNFGNRKGINNGMSGKKHSDNTKEQMSKIFRVKIGTIRKNKDYCSIKINNKDKWKYLHRYLVEKYIGYKLNKKWVVHHIDGNGLNNKLSNLYIFKSSNLHLCFENLVNHKVLNKNYIKSNLKEFKK
jgi:hypothetical protein